MRIDGNETIAGVKLMRIRDVLRRAGDFGFYRVRIEYLLHCDAEKAATILAELERRGFVARREPDPVDEGDECWSLTDLGRQFNNATAAKPLRRATCDRAVREMLDRVEIVRDDDYYKAQVSCVWLFGSYPAGADRPNDVDVYIELEMKEQDSERQLEVMVACERRCPYDGLRAISWVWDEPTLFIKNRSRVLSISKFDSWVKEDPGGLLVYEHPNRRHDPPYRLRGDGGEH